MLGKLCVVFVFSVSDGIHVVGKSLLECVSVSPMHTLDLLVSFLG